MAQKCWQIIPCSAQVSAEFEQKSQGAFSTIALTVCTSHLYLITSVEKPKDSWDALCNHFEWGDISQQALPKEVVFLY